MPSGANATDFRNRLSATAFAFRGYNLTNLGRTPELLSIEAYRPIVERHLQEAAALCSEVSGKPVDLVQRVEQHQEAGLDAYDEAIALVFAAEFAQLELLREFHGVDYTKARLAFGYSLGELVAAAASGAFPREAVLKVPLTFATDCAEMAKTSTMGVLFSRKAKLDEGLITRLCEEVTSEGHGSIGVSAILAPNTVLVLGQGDTLDQVTQRVNSESKTPVLLRRNEGLWPPLHTRLVRQRHVPDRAALLIEKIRRVSDTPTPPILSLVTGRQEYADSSGRETLRDWVDHPQRLWDAVCGVLASDAKRVVHVGPAPNVIPATFRRLAENVTQQTLAWSLSGIGMRAAKQLATRPWLANLLPKQGVLLRAPSIEQVVLEDWLIDQAPV